MQFRRIAKSAPVPTAGVAGAVTFVAVQVEIDSLIDD